MSKFGMAGCGALLLLGVVASGCFRNTTSMIELKIPAMKTQACEQLVRTGLDQLGDAVLNKEFDLESQTVWVTYDNVRLGRRNVEVAISNMGFAVNDWPADKQAHAKLAPECRGDE